MRSNPFVGLRPFEAGDTHLFFGRDRQVDELLLRLRTQRFVAVLGSSGSGKSSLVRAGLQPALEGGMLGGGGASWRAAILRPGGDPIGQLAAAVERAGAWRSAGSGSGDARAILNAVLRRGSLGLVEAVDESGLPRDDALLIVVDQFEELFRFKHAASGAAENAAAFVKLLLEAARATPRAIGVVLTMRSEFLGNCAEFRDLPEAINDGLFLIPRLTRDQLAQAITGPIAVAGARIAPSLVQRLINDVGDDPDQLPVLQHALMRMWDRRDGDGTLTLDHYDAVKGMRQALSEHADEAFRELDEPQRLIAEHAFRALTERGADGHEVRHPMPLGEIAESAGASVGTLIDVVDGFRQEGRSFLMPPAPQALLPATVIDISHESLIRKWSRLRDWVNQEAEDRRVYLRVVESAAGHFAGQEPLWRNPRLEWADQWRRRFKPTHGWARRYAPDLDRAMAFLDASLADRRAERRRRQAGVLGALVFIGLLAGTGWWMYDEQRRRQIDQRNQDAEAEKLLAVADEKTKTEAVRRELAEQQSQLARQRAQLLQRDVATADEQRRDAESQSKRLAIRFADRNASTSPTGGEIAALVALHSLIRARQDRDMPTAAAAQSALDKNLRLLPPIIWRLRPANAVTGLVGLAGTKLLTIDTVSGKSSVWDTTSASPRALGETELGVRVRPGQIASGRRNVVWVADKALRIWDSESDSNETLTDPSFQRVVAIAASAGGRAVAVTGPDGTRLWDVESRQSRLLDTTAFDVLAFGGHDDLVAGARSNVLRVWNAETGEQVLPDLTITDTTIPLPPAISPNGAYVATATGAALHLLKVGVGQVPIEPMRKGTPIHTQRVNDVAFSPDNTYLASASDDQSAAIVQIGQESKLSARLVWSGTHSGSVRRVAFSHENPPKPDGSARSWLLATAGGDNTARVWWNRDVDGSRDNDWSEIVRMPHGGAVRALAFTGDGHLVTSDSTGLLRAAIVTPPEGVEPSSGSTSVAKFCARVSRNLTGREWAAYFPTQPYESACPDRPLDPVEVLDLIAARIAAGETAAAAAARKQLLALPNLGVLDPKRVVVVAAGLWETGSRVDAAQLFRLAVGLTVKGSAMSDAIRADLGNHVCWEGVIRDFADEVWDACVEAVRLNASFSNVDSRGVASALRGDLTSALADFTFYVERAKDRSIERIARRKGWVEELTAGRNPFAPKVRSVVLAELREETAPLPIDR